MSLATQLQNLVTRLGTEFKSVRSSIGPLADLSTTAKSSLVVAVNEVRSQADGAATTGNDNAVKIGQLTNLNTNSKASLVLAVNELQSQFAAAAKINDTTASATSLYSAQKVVDLLAALKTELLGGAGAAYDTLKELQDLLVSDGTALSALTTAVGNRVRFDAAQTLDSTQKAQAIANIGAISAADVGDVTTDFVAAFNTAIA